MNILAAFIFFTRLPFWRIREVPAECFKHVVPYWPLSGWLTGGIMAGVLWLSAQILPFSVAVLLALAARLLITGALHGRFLRWIRRRYEPGADSLHHERFAYRQLRCHRVDFLLPSSMESFDVAPPLLRMYYIDCRRHDKQADLITNHQLPALRTKRRRKQGQSSI